MAAWAQAVAAIKATASHAGDDGSHTRAAPATASGEVAADLVQVLAELVLGRFRPP
jgi:hypothetical protein